MEFVGTSAARDPVAAAADDVQTGPTEDDVIPAIADQQIVTIRAIQRIVAVQQIGAVAAPDAIIVRTTASPVRDTSGLCIRQTIVRIRPRPGVDFIVPSPAKDRVATVGADVKISAKRDAAVVVAGKAVSPSAARDAVVAHGAFEGLCARTIEQIGPHGGFLAVRQRQCRGQIRAFDLARGGGKDAGIAVRSTVDIVAGACADTIRHVDAMDHDFAQRERQDVV
ncbi:hypothetical protein AL036_19660 [Salipiger aestuarii]|nr:hypothetical protein AL036_19660 [Salipiger aestuarii]